MAFVAVFQAGRRVRVLMRPVNMPIRVGFLIGKAQNSSSWVAWFTTEILNDGQDTDLVEDAKYVGDASFLKDMPDKHLDRKYVFHAFNIL